MIKPTVETIMAAIAYSGLWLNPEDQWEHSWACILYDPEGERVSDAYALTAEQAAAQAWVQYWAPTPPVTPGSVPFDIGDGWKFELLPPFTPDEIAEMTAEGDAFEQPRRIPLNVAAATVRHRTDDQQTSIIKNSDLLVNDYQASPARPRNYP